MKIPEPEMRVWNENKKENSALFKEDNNEKRINVVNIEEVIDLLN